MFEGTQVIFAVLKWIGVAMCLGGFAMAMVTLADSSYPRPEPGVAMAWVLVGGAGVSTWAVSVIGEMIGYTADRARRTVELLEQINARPKKG